MLSQESILEQVNHLKALEKEGKLIGEFKNIPAEVYHHPQCPAYSRSDLVTVRQSSVGHLLAKKSGIIPHKETDSKSFGNTFHSFILEPEIFAKTHADPFPIPRPVGAANKTKANGGCKEEYDVWKKELEAYTAANEGKIILDNEDFQKMKAMEAELISNPLAMSLIRGADAEYENTYFYKCPISGLLMKFRPDVILKKSGIMIDLKTATDASPMEFARSMANFYYDLQGAQYCFGAKELFGYDFTFGFVVSEKEPPYPLALYGLGDAEKEVGMELYKDTVSKIVSYKPEQKCYGTEFQNAYLPAWAYTPAYR